MSDSPSPTQVALETSEDKAIDLAHKIAAEVNSPSYKMRIESLRRIAEDHFRFRAGYIPPEELRNRSMSGSGGFKRSARGHHLYSDAHGVYLPLGTPQQKNMGALLLGNAPIGFEAEREAELEMLMAVGGSKIGDAMMYGVDGLTQLLRREIFEAEFSRVLEQAHQHDFGIGVYMIDADFFKRINDEHGHEAGDVVLRKLAATCKGSLRPHDIVGRYGGEELIACALFLDDVEPSDRVEVGYHLGERIRTAVNSLEIEVAQGDTTAIITPTVSIGYVCFPEQAEQAVINYAFRTDLPQPDERKGALMRHLREAADQALYRAKQSGRDRTMTYDHLAAVET